MIRKGTIIESTVSDVGIRKGERFITIKDDEHAVFYDRDGDRRQRASFKVIGHIDDVEAVQRPKPKDIQGNEVKVGDNIAYAFAGAQSRHLALFEVLSVNGLTAMCRAKKDGAVTTLGVFEERAIIIS